LIVGGPSTAQAAWVAPFLAHTKANSVPVDFVSTHVYGNDRAEDVLGTHEQIPRDKMVWRAVQKVHNEIAHSPYPNMPLLFSEYNASYANEPNITDSTYMGPWLANNIRLCDGLTQSMSYWAFSDVFEEQGVIRSPFYGGFGVMAIDGIPKPAFNAFSILHKLGDRRIPITSDSVLATATGNNISLALWNYAPPTGEGASYIKPSGPAGPGKTFNVELKNVPANATVTVWRVDDDHSNVLKAFDAMGRPPADLTQDQIAKLRTAGALSPPEHLRLTHGKLKLSVPAHGLAVVTLEGK
jgi:xylan 1,4-beta-xylosidase